MTTETRARRRIRGRFLGGLALAGLVMLGVSGVLSRNAGQAKLRTWTALQAIPSVSIVTPKPLQGAQELSLPGTIKAFYDAPIYARVSGYLKSWRRDIGAHVKQGEVLALIDTPDLDQQLNQARANLVSAQADQRLAQLTAKRWRALLASNSVSQQTVDEKSGAAEAGLAAVRAAQANVDRLTALQGFRVITAPFDGVVTARRTDVGALIDAGGGRGPELFRVADLHEMRVYVPVPQSVSAEITPGTEAALSVSPFPGRVFRAVLDTTSNAVSEESRTVLFELLAPNPDGALLPGTYAQVRFRLHPQAGHLEIPTSAVIFQEHGTQVAVLGPDDRASLKPVTLGRDGGVSVEILSGISPGDRIIDSPPDSLDSGDKVRPVGNAGQQRQVAAATVAQ